MGATPDPSNPTPRIGSASSSDDAGERVLVEQRALEADRLKSDLLANSAHALRGPLNVIIGFAELMHGGKVGALAPEHHEFVGDILKSGRHLLRLLNDLLDLARVDFQKVELRLEEVDVAQALHDVRDVVRGLAASRRIRLEQDIDDGIGSVFVDPVRVKQILYSFISTGIQLTAPGGKVTVRARGAGEALFRLEVEYSGTRVTPNAPAQHDAPAASAPSLRPNTGVALATWLAEAHRGRVETSSEAGNGGVFTTVLPRRTAPKTAGR